MELGVFGEQAVPERGDELGARAAAVQESVRLVAGFVDHALHVEAVRERVEASARRVRRARRGHVEEAVEVDAQRRVHRAAQELRSTAAAAAPGAARSRR